MRGRKLDNAGRNAFNHAVGYNQNDNQGHKAYSDSRNCSEKAFQGIGNCFSRSDSEKAKCQHDRNPYFHCLTNLPSIRR
jgi:hypothetical protein